MQNPLKRLWHVLSRRRAKAEAQEQPKTQALQSDPLDPTHRVKPGSGWKGENEPVAVFRSIADFPVLEISQAAFRSVNGKQFAMDAAPVIQANVAMDEVCGPGAAAMTPAYSVPEEVANWYLSHSFIGYQACALIAQHWLVDKACSMAGEDAVRHGWEIKSVDEDNPLTDEQHDQLVEYDKGFKLKFNLEQLNRFKNIFGIRVAIFQVESDDPDYYSKPFNIDGVTEGSYRGISQVDPYWMMPLLTAESTGNPGGKHFYEPEFWVVNGKKYHRSHLIIARAPEPADVLKPTYLFGGVPMAQRIYERVYAAERTANEAPLLAMSKRMTAIHVDMEKAVLNQDKLYKRILQWIAYRDNHQVKVLGKEEVMEQFDIALSDLDSVIMNQYQLVAAIAEVPATKLLGTSPKGFNATGEFEMISYHEKLESIQEHVMSPMLERHYKLLCRHLGLDVIVQHVWRPVDSITATQRAELNLKKAQTGEALINAGAISPEEERSRIRDDEDSGYNRLSDEAAEEKPGASPENLAEFEKAGAAAEKANATPEGATVKAAGTTHAGETADPKASTAEEALPETPYGARPAAPAADPNVMMVGLLQKMAERLGALEDVLLPEGGDVPPGSESTLVRTTQPSVKPSVQATVRNPKAVIGPQPHYLLPKVKVNDLICVIENPRNSVRQGRTLDGEEWSVSMPHHYGYIKGTEGADGDEVDCFVGPNPKSQRVFVVNQKDKEGIFDEHKCMLGFDTPEQAREAYEASFTPGWDGLDSMHECPVEAFKQWLAQGARRDPFAGV